MAEAGLVSLAEQVEHADALAEVVIRLGRAAGRGVEPPAKPQKLAPRPAHRAGLHAVGDALEPPLRDVGAAERQQRLDGDELRLQRVDAGRVAGPGDFRRDGERRGGIASAQREPRLERLHRPLIPAARERLAVGLARLLQAPARLVVLSADQVNLRERIEHGAGRLAHEVQRAAHVERAVEHLFRAPQIADPHADLSERRQRDAEPVRRARLLLQLDAALGERQRLIVPVLHQRHVGLVAADGGQHVARLDHHRQTLGLAQRRDRLVEPSFLRERHAGERVHHREVTPVAGGVQRGGRAGDVLADDGHVADLPVAEPELVVGEPDGARIVRALGLLQRLRQERDAARRLAARHGQPAVHAPQVRQPGRVEPLPPLRRIAQRLGRLPDVVLQQPGLGQRAADLGLLVAVAAGLFQCADEEGGGLRAVPVLERCTAWP